MQEQDRGAQEEDWELTVGGGSPQGLLHPTAPPRSCKAQQRPTTQHPPTSSSEASSC